MNAARTEGTGSIATEEDNLVNQYHQLAFFWEKLGLTKHDLQTEPARWVLSMIKIGEAEAQERTSQIEAAHRKRVKRR